MITEDYVSFEVAKLLKDKGFDEKCNSYFISNNEIALIANKRDFNKHGIYLSAPTLQRVMKWLRKVHNIYIDISPTYSEEEKTIHFIWQIFDSNYDGVGDCEIFYDKYEIACEEAIKYCLENLI
jgi:hypothetical protein